MKNKSNRLLYTLEVLLGVILMGGVFLIAVHVDVRSAKRTLTSTVSYIKEQCNQYERLNLASETKSMMRNHRKCAPDQSCIDRKWNRCRSSDNGNAGAMGAGQLCNGCIASG